MKALKVFITLAIVFGTATIANAWVQFNDGEVHDFNRPFYEDVWVDYNKPGMKTTVNFFDGGVYASDHKLQSFENSIVNFGGRSIIYHLYTHDSSQVNINNEESSFNYLTLYDNSQVDNYNGHIDWLTLYGNSQVDSYSGHIEHIHTYNNSQLNVFGGIMPDSYFYGNSQINMFGGTIKSPFNNIHLSDNATLTLYGSDFAIDGVLIEYEELFGILNGDINFEPNRALSGLWGNGEEFSFDFKLGYNSKIVFAHTPIPGAVWLLGSSLLFLVVARKRIK